MHNLSERAQRAVEVVRKVHRSTGWMFSRPLFRAEPDLLDHFSEIAEELTAAGFLDKTVTLVENTGVEEMRYVELSEEDIAEAEKCVGTKDTFVHPETGEEILLVPGDLCYFYCTTKKMPIAPSPPDERAVALYRKFEEQRSRAPESQAGTWQDAMDDLVRAFDLPPEVTRGEKTAPRPPSSTPAASPATRGS